MLEPVKSLRMLLFAGVAMGFYACGDSSTSSADMSNGEVPSSSDVVPSSSDDNVESSFSGNILPDIPVYDISSSSESSSVHTYISMTDPRDNKTYKTITIGSQTWMAENLNYADDQSWCFKDYDLYCAEKGRLYTWAAAVNACPAGWHLPSSAEWSALLTTVGGQDNAGTVLKSTSGWNCDGNGSDAYGFSGLPAGFRTDEGSFYNASSVASFWSSTQENFESAYVMTLNSTNVYAVLGVMYKPYATPVRCLKD